jgi:hypothetical protein
MTVAPLRAVAVPIVAGLLALAGWIGPARADDRIGVMAAALETPANGSGGVYLDATFEFEMPPALEDALQKGIALYFSIDFDLYRDRWYWFDKKLLSTSLTYRLSYSPLTRQYRLARGGLSQPFDSLDEALALLKSVRGWRVFDRAMLRPGDEYSAQLRMRLDTSQLPKPFQVNAITSREWNLSSEWRGVKVPPEPAL